MMLYLPGLYAVFNAHKNQLDFINHIKYMINNMYYSKP